MGKKIIINCIQQILTKCSLKVVLIETNIYSNIVHMFRTFESQISKIGANVETATEPILLST